MNIIHFISIISIIYNDYDTHYQHHPLYYDIVKVYNVYHNQSTNTLCIITTHNEYHP